MSKRYYGGILTSLPPAPPGLYTFTTFTFKPIVAAQSAVGPTLAEMQTAYAGQVWLSSYFTMGTLQGYQRWTVPSNGSYTIEAGGAMGGDGLGPGGYGANSTVTTLAYGAVIRGNFTLTSGDVLEIVVGSKGGSSGGAHGNENGGGGGTFVKNITTNTLLLVAGGAGGAPSSAYGTSCTRTVSIGHGQAGNASGNDSCSTTAATPSIGSGGNTAGSYQGGAGGGYATSGANGGTHCATSYGGGSYGSGLVGGTGNTCYNALCNGGFGGGGGGQLGGPGGGGGYTGGNCTASWSSYSTYGGGGGSYNVGTLQTNTAGGNTSNLGGYVGAGYCKITRL